MKRALSAVGAVLLLTSMVFFGGCEDDPFGTEYGLTGDASINLLIPRELQTSVESVRITATAADFDTLTAWLTIQDSVATGTITVPAGPNRVFTVDVFMTGGVHTHTGAETTDVHPFQTVELTIYLTQLTGMVSITVVLPDFYPIVSSIFPIHGPMIGGTRVTISGLRFQEGASISIGEAEADSVEVLSATSITCVTTAVEDARTYDVTVTNPNGAVGTLQQAYTTVSPPIVYSLTPDHVFIEDIAHIDISGDGFLDGATVTIGGEPSEITDLLPDYIQVLPYPWDGEGEYEVIVTNPDGQTSTTIGEMKYLTYLHLLPVLREVIPPTGSQLGGETVIVACDNVREGTEVYFGTRLATDVIIVDQWSLECTTPPGDLPGFVTVRVLNPDGQDSYLTDGYEYLGPPEIFGVSPNVGSTMGDIMLEIDGHFFQEGHVAIMISHDGTSPVYLLRAEEPYSDQFILPPHGPGYVDIAVRNPDGQEGALENAFLYATPDISSLSPDTGDINGNEIVEIYGSNFHSLAQVFFDSQNPTSAELIWANEGVIRVRTPPHAAGTVDVIVRHGDGYESVLENAFTFIEPSTRKP